MFNWSDPARCIGGRSFQVRDLAEQLQKQGHEVAIVDARSPRAYGAAYGGGVDVVHSHGGWASLCTMLTALRVPLPRDRPLLVSTLHGWHDRGILDWIEQHVERAGLLLSDIITVPSKAAQVLLPAYLREKSTVVWNGVRAVTSSRITVGDLVNMLWMGRICPEKDPETAIRAWGRVHESNPNVRLHMVGPLEDRRYRQLLDATSSRFGNHFRYWGTIDQPWEAVSVDVLLHTSRREGLSRVVLEAMSAGIPVVAAAVGGIPEAIQDGATGYLVGAGNVEQFTRALENLAGDRGLRAAMGEHAAKVFQRRFTIEVMAASIGRLYETGGGN